MTFLNPFPPHQSTNEPVFLTFVNDGNEESRCTSPATLIVYTFAITTLLYLGLYLAYKYRPRILRRDPKQLIKYVINCIPKYQKKIADEYTKFRANQEFKLFKDINPHTILTKLPEKGLSKGHLLTLYQDIAGNTHNGKNTGAVYNAYPELSQTAREISDLAAFTNPLHLNLAPLIRQKEAEACFMIGKKYGGDDEVCGNITSGGTESIHHAVYATRERASSMGITDSWEMILPTTAHPAFRKSAHQLNIKIINAPVYPADHPKAFEANADAIRKLINRNTILVVCSLPSYPHGICDPVEEVSQILEEADPGNYIGLHVDGCLGGFVIPFMKEAGFDDGPQKFGYELPRVTSISADTHKYGADEKGSSIITFRNIEWKKHLIYVDQNWEGGIYATPTLPGSRPGHVIVRTHATMCLMGNSGLVEQTRKLITTTRALTERIKANEHLKLLGNPKASVIAFTFKDSQHNIHDLNDEMKKSHWYFAGLQKPNGIHFCLTPVHSNNPNFIEEFMRDLERSIETVIRKLPEERGKSSDARTYGSNERIDEQLFVEDFAEEYWKVASQVLPKTFTFNTADSSDPYTSSSS